MAISGTLGALHKQTDAAAVAFTDEATTGNVARTRYTITNTTKRYWDKTAAVTVKVDDGLGGGPVVQTTGFTLEHPGGVVVFEVARAVGDTVTVSGSYVAVTQVGGVFNWSLDLEHDTAEVTTFASAGWKEFLATIKGFTGSAEAYWDSGGLFDSLGDDLILVFYVDATAGSLLRYEGYGIINGLNPEAAVDDVVSEGVEIQGNGPLYYREG